MNPAPSVRRIRRRCRRWLLLAGLLLLTLAAAGCGGAPMARDFEVPLFDGGRFKLSEQAGKRVVALNFWYPSCPPCREEMPQFEAAWQELAGEPAVILGLFVPQGFDSEADARDFAAEHSLSFPLATDPLARIAEGYELEVFPTTIFIGLDGRIAAAHTRALNAAQITGIIRSLADGKS